ncbi:MAG: hypothetical protein ACKVPX_07120 [Myxococcaceae bacterium]
MSLLDVVRTEFDRANIQPASIKQVSSGSMGSGEVIAELGSLVLRVLSDRGELFLDVAPAAFPSEFQYFADVEIAFGWRTMESVLKGSHESLNSVLNRFAQHCSELEKAFGGDAARWYLAKVSATRAKRAELRWPSHGA